MVVPDKGTPLPRSNNSTNPQFSNNESNGNNRRHHHHHQQQQSRPPQSVQYSTMTNPAKKTQSGNPPMMSPPPRRKVMRSRSDSVDSTSGAFAPLPASLVSPSKSVSPSKKTPSKKVSSPENILATSSSRRRKKRTTPKTVMEMTPSPEKLIGMDLGDLASLAMASVNQEDLMLEKDMFGINHKSSSPMVVRHENPLLTNSTSAAHPPRAPVTTTLTDHKTSGLINERDNYFTELDQLSGLPSEVSPLNFLEQRAVGKSIRENSLQYSDANMDTALSSLRTLASGMPNPIQSNIQSSREMSLMGTRFLEDLESPKNGYGSVVHSSSSFASTSGYIAKQQQEDIARFSSMVLQESADAGNTGDGGPTVTLIVTPPTPQAIRNHDSVMPSNKDLSYDSSAFDKDTSWQLSTDAIQHEADDENPSLWSLLCWNRCKKILDPLTWVDPIMVVTEDGSIYYDEPPSLTCRLARNFLYTPEDPEFTSLQQFVWALILGMVMGVYTALWKHVIEFCVEFMWKTVPERLYLMGVFTDLNGVFPLPHYMWLCPSIFGGILSYIFVVLPKQIPGQNEWIKALHSRGVQDPDTFVNLFVLSTAGMSSGLSLGPELPLILTGGMIGSYLGVVTHQSILSARAMNLTAASAAVAGFFGFPMAGALFVLEVPHRMGLQYFEALSPATIASIVAVLVNRMILQNDVTGYYNYPFLTTTLPSHIFYIAIVYGLVGALVGVFYCNAVKKLKGMVHDWFHVAHVEEETSEKNEKLVSGDLENGDGTADESFLNRKEMEDEVTPLVHTNSTVTQKARSKQLTLSERMRQTSSRVLQLCGIRNEPMRAAVAGTLAGFCTGVICMFVPHVLFWGEAQLQTLIDKGRTPLPVFGEEGEPTADLIAYGYCLIDSDDAAAIEAGFNVGCAAMISIAKIVVTGLSLGTGIIGGHFWGPLFVGCVASHLFTDLVRSFSHWTGMGMRLADFPCVAILCIMGSTHVVTFRAHMAIMLILTLTISAFYPDQNINGVTAGDYSAVFPLLVVSCFVSVMATRGAVFYTEQRCRGDIMAAPEVLCEPGKEGSPMVVDYAEDLDSEDDDGEFSYYSTSEDDGDEDDLLGSFGTHPDESIETSTRQRAQNQHQLTQSDIEKAFAKAQQANFASVQHLAKEEGERRSTIGDDIDLHRTDTNDRDLPTARQKSMDSVDEGSDKLSEILSRPLTKPNRLLGRHRRVRSTTDIDPSLPAPVFKVPGHSRSGSMSSSGRRSRSNSMSSRKSGSEERLTRVTTFGELKEFHPSLFDGARQRAASVHRPPSLPKVGRHSRKNSEASNFSDVGSGTGVALTQDDIERSMGSNRRGYDVS